MGTGKARNYLLLVVLILISCMGVGEALIRLAGLFLIEVDYLASASYQGRPRYYNSLDSFISSQKHLIPGRNWANYYTNRLGFNDQEFEPAKPQGRFRIMALGDSFCYGMVPYPFNVQTLVEERLKRDCGTEVEVLNLGLPGAHTWEYETLFSLARPVYAPDLVVIHFYMGNDGPDLVRHKDGIPARANPVWHSRLYSFVRNSLKLLKSVENNLEARPESRDQAGQEKEAAIRGGTKVAPGLPDPTDQNPDYLRPRFTAAAFAEQMADELVRFYNPGKGAEDRDWAPVLKNLEAVRRSAGQGGARMALVLYPSVLQVYPERMAETAAREAAGRSIEGFDPARIDPSGPNRILKEYAQKNSLPLLDLTPRFVRAARESKEPLYLNRDTHWNLKGNRLAAEGEAGFLKELVCAQGPKP